MAHCNTPVALALNTGASVHEEEVIIGRPDGSRVHVSVHIDPIRNPKDGQIIGVVNYFHDLTERKRQESERERLLHEAETRAAELQEAREELESKIDQRTIALRHLSSHLMHVQDEERRRIARELHDSIGQYLAALGMSVTQLETAKGAKFSEALTECRQLLDRCTNETRTLSQLLHPPLLDEAGFGSARISDQHSSPLWQQPRKHSGGHRRRNSQHGDKGLRSRDFPGTPGKFQDLRRWGWNRPRWNPRATTRSGWQARPFFNCRGCNLAGELANHEHS